MKPGSGRKTPCKTKQKTKQHKEEEELISSQTKELIMRQKLLQTKATVHEALSFEL